MEMLYIYFQDVMMAAGGGREMYRRGGRSRYARGGRYSNY